MISLTTGKLCSKVSQKGNDGGYMLPHISTAHMDINIKQTFIGNYG